MFVTTTILFTVLLASPHEGATFLAPGSIEQELIVESDDALHRYFIYPGEPHRQIDPATTPLPVPPDIVPRGIPNELTGLGSGSTMVAGVWLASEGSDDSRRTDRDDDSSDEPVMVGGAYV